MSNQLRIQASLQIVNGDFQWSNQPTGITANQAGVPGTFVGAVLVSQNGTDINLSNLTTPGGWCRIFNTDPTNYVTYGVRDPDTNKFYPVGELLAGEFVIIRLSRLLGADIAGTGSAEFQSDKLFHFEAHGASLYVQIDAMNA